MTNPVIITINPKNSEVELDTDRMVEFYRKWNIDLRVEENFGRVRLQRGRAIDKVCAKCLTVKPKSEFRQIEQKLENGGTRMGQRMRVCITCEQQDTRVCLTCKVEKPVVEFRRQTKDKPRKNCQDCQRAGLGIAGPKGHVDWTRKPCSHCLESVKVTEFPTSEKGRILWVCKPCLARLAVEKTCRICKATKPAEKFEKHNAALGGRRHECRDCIKARRRVVRADS